jgi:hypothetical protein
VEGSWACDRLGSREVCQRVQISELFSIEKCDQAVMDFLAAAEVGKLQRR